LLLLALGSAEHRKEKNMDLEQFARDNGLSVADHIEGGRTGVAIFAQVDSDRVRVSPVFADTVRLAEFAESHASAILSSAEQGCEFPSARLVSRYRRHLSNAIAEVRADVDGKASMLKIFNDIERTGITADEREKVEGHIASLGEAIEAGTSEEGRLNALKAVIETAPSAVFMPIGAAVSVDCGRPQSEIDRNGARYPTPCAGSQGIVVGCAPGGRWAVQVAFPDGFADMDGVFIAPDEDKEARCYYFDASELELLSHAFLLDGGANRTADFVQTHPEDEGYGEMVLETAAGRLSIGFDRSLPDISAAGFRFRDAVSPREEAVDRGFPASP
jgi:hypothetical protein